MTPYKFYINDFFYFNCSSALFRIKLYQKSIKKLSMEECMEKIFLIAPYQ